MTTKADAVSSTPAAEWRANGEPDPHGKHYDGERAALTLGTLTDDELANEAFLNYDRRLSLDDLLHPKPGRHMPIVWMTAVKERIRWLSRALERALAPEVQAGAVPDAYQQFLDETKDATRPYARRALIECIAECQALSYSEDRGITISEAESIGGVLHELRRLQNLEAEAVEVVTTNGHAEATRAVKDMPVDFVIDSDGILRWQNDGCRPANETEIALWNELLVTRGGDAGELLAEAVRVPEGFALVPIKPNDVMQAAGAQAVRIDTTVINRIWTANAVFRAMVSAASSAGDQS
ncbi:hypothetical protein PQR64_23355 [Paraburkholderia phytofirmans]|uniref:hypothetical protein n=1 Tax=Paraburkholderia phytofirmans TaxID=261302 RepID=UPI0038B95A37